VWEGGGYKVDPHIGSVQQIQGMIGGNYPGNLSLIHASDTYFYSYCIKYMQYYVTNTSPKLVSEPRPSPSLISIT
jgi:hypothetical protein